MAKLSIKTPKGWLQLKSTYDLIKDAGYTGTEDEFASLLNNLISKPAIPDLIQLGDEQREGNYVLHPILGDTNLSATLAECIEPTIIKCVLPCSLRFSSDTNFELMVGQEKVAIKSLRIIQGVNLWANISEIYPDCGFEIGDIIELCVCNPIDGEPYVHLLTTPYKIMETSSF